MHKNAILIKRVFSLIAAISTSLILLILPLSGCTKNNNAASIDSLYETPEFVYVAQTVPIPNSIGAIRALALSDEKLYIATTTTIYDDEGLNTHISYSEIYSMDIEGTNLAKLANYTPSMTARSDIYGGSDIQFLYVDVDDSLWVVESWHLYGFDLPLDFDADNDSLWEHYTDIELGGAIRKLDSSGNEILAVDIGDIESQKGYFNVTAFIVDIYGNIYLCAEYWDSGDTLIHVFDNGGNLRFSFNSDFYIDQFISMPDNQIAFPIGVLDERGNYSQVLRKIDYIAQEYGEVVFFPDLVGQDVFPGSGEYSIFVADYQGLSAFVEGEPKPIELLNWRDSDIVYSWSRSISNFKVLSDEHILCTRSFLKVTLEEDRMASRIEHELLTLTKTPYSQLPEKTIITLATCGLNSEIDDAIAYYNKTSQDYRIQIVDYSEYNTESDQNAGLTRFITDIFTGKTPDILDVWGLPYREYAYKGLFADLYPFIDSDPDYNRSDFVDNVFLTAEVDGKLYQVFPSFGINTMVGNPSVLGPDIGWNLQELKAVLAAHPEADIPLGTYTNMLFLNKGVEFGTDEYIDWKTGIVCFDDPSFLQLLEFANMMPSMHDYETYVLEEEAVATGRQLAIYTSLWNLSDIPMFNQIFGGEIVFKGFPTESGNGNSLSIDGGLAITADSPNKEAAWSFVRTILDKDWQLANCSGFRTNLAAFTKRAEIEMEIGATYPLVGRFNQEDLDQLMDLIDSASGKAQWNIDKAIWYIISEEASIFFSGALRAEDAARIIQSRVSLLVAERTNNS